MAIQLRHYELPYGFADLEPHIDEETMHYHRKYHYGGYFNKFIEALKKIWMGTEVIEEEFFFRLKELDIPKDIKTQLRNNWGGWRNHTYFWHWMKPWGLEPSAAFAKVLEKNFGSVEGFLDQLLKEGLARFGSWWVWVVKKEEDKLEIYSLPNQDNPLMQGDFNVVLGLDVWEHAYYLRYRHRRDEYIKAWQNVINWDTVERLFVGEKILSS